MEKVVTNEKIVSIPDNGESTGWVSKVTWKMNSGQIYQEYK